MTDKELQEFIDVGENKFMELAMIFGDVWTSKAIQIAAEYKARLAVPLYTIEQVKDVAQKLTDCALMSSPPKKEWVGLTDKEVVMLAYQSQENECTAIRLAEQALKEKNSE
jgi:hypothetical protein